MAQKSVKRNELVCAAVVPAATVTLPAASTRRATPTRASANARTSWREPSATCAWTERRVWSPAIRLVAVKVGALKLSLFQFAATFVQRSKLKTKSRMACTKRWIFCLVRALHVNASLQLRRSSRRRTTRFWGPPHCASSGRRPTFRTASSPTTRCIATASRSAHWTPAVSTADNDAQHMMTCCLVSFAEQVKCECFCLAITDSWGR